MATLVASLADEMPAEVPKVRGRVGGVRGEGGIQSPAHYPPTPFILAADALPSRPPQMRQTTSQLCPPTLPTLQVLQVLLERLRNEVTRLPAVRGRGAEGGG